SYVPFHRAWLIPLRPRRQGLLNQAVSASVEKVDGKPDYQPHDQSQPRIVRQGGHQEKADDHSENGHERHEGDLERTMQFGTAHVPSITTRLPQRTPVA